MACGVVKSRLILEVNFHCSPSESIKNQRRNKKTSIKGDDTQHIACYVFNLGNEKVIFPPKTSTMMQ
jgi:hypothetical protein